MKRNAKESTETRDQRAVCACEQRAPIASPVSSCTLPFPILTSARSFNSQEQRLALAAVSSLFRVLFGSSSLHVRNVCARSTALLLSAMLNGIVSRAER